MDIDNDVLNQIKNDVRDIKICLLGDLTKSHPGLCADVTSLKSWKSIVNKSVLFVASTVGGYSLLKIIPVLISLL